MIKQFLKSKELWFYGKLFWLAGVFIVTWSDAIQTLTNYIWLFFLFRWCLLLNSGVFATKKLVRCMAMLWEATFKNPNLFNFCEFKNCILSHGHYFVVQLWLLHHTTYHQVLVLHNFPAALSLMSDSSGVQTFLSPLTCCPNDQTSTRSSLERSEANLFASLLLWFAHTGCWSENLQTT